jgi:hypothetical protein
MNRVALGAVCVATFLFTATRYRRALGTFVLEQMEHAFDAVEDVWNY